MKKISLVFSILLLGTGLVACGGSTANDGGGSSNNEALEVVGSTSVSPLMEVFGETYGKDGGTVINIQSVGSSAGIKAATDGSANIGMSSRELKDEEKASLEEVVIALDGIAVVVNPENGVDNLTKDQVKEIFQGKITNWKDVGGSDEAIVVISREEGSGTRGAFEELLKLEEEKDGKKVTTVTGSALIADGNGAVKQNVGTKKAAIGYLSLGAVDDTVKSTTIDGVTASEETVKDGTYGIKRPFLLVTKGAPSESAQKFIDFILSADGQKIVSEEGYITIK